MERKNPSRTFYFIIYFILYVVGWALIESNAADLRMFKKCRIKFSIFQKLANELNIE